MTVAQVASAEDAEIVARKGGSCIKDRAHRFFADSSLQVAEVKLQGMCFDTFTTNSKSSAWIKEYLVSIKSIKAAPGDPRKLVQWNVGVSHC